MALRGNAPRGDRVTTGGLVLALAAAVRVVDRVHDGAANARTDALPAVAAGLADLDVGMLGVAHLADGGAAGDEHAAHLGGRHAQDGVVALLAHELDARAGRAGDGRALARLQLDRVDERTDRDVGQGQRVARLDVGLGAAHHRVAHAQALRMQDVALLAVNIVQKGDAGAAVRVVLDGSDLGGHAIFVALEVDDAVTALVATALMAGGDAAVVVATCLVGQRRKQGLLRLVRRDLGEVRDRLEASAGACRLVLFDSHVFPFCGFSLARLSVPRKPFVSSWTRLPRRTVGRLGPCDSDVPRVRVYPSMARRKRELYAENHGYSRRIS